LELLSNFFQEEKFLPSKNPLLPMGREEIPFFQEETQPCFLLTISQQVKAQTNSFAI